MVADLNSLVIYLRESWSLFFFVLFCYCKLKIKRISTDNPIYSCFKTVYSCFKTIVHFLPVWELKSWQWRFWVSLGLSFLWPKEEYNTHYKQYNIKKGNTNGISKNITKSDPTSGSLLPLLLTKAIFLDLINKAIYHLLIHSPVDRTTGSMGANQQK